VASLHKRLGGLLSFTVPPGGMALWALADGVDVDSWAERSLSRGAAFYPGRHFAFDGKPRAALRLGFAALTEAELDEGVRRIASSLPRA